MCAFAYSGIEEIIIPSSVTSLDEGVFSECERLNKVVLQDGLETIKEQCFAGTLIREISIPKSVKHIGNSTFAQCSNLTSVSFFEDA